MLVEASTTSESLRTMDVVNHFLFLLRRSSPFQQTKNTKQHSDVVCACSLRLFFQNYTVLWRKFVPFIVTSSVAKVVARFSCEHAPSSPQDPGPKNHQKTSRKHWKMRPIIMPYLKGFHDLVLRQFGWVVRIATQHELSSAVLLETATQHELSSAISGWVLKYS